jgi:hypothetical protein
MQDATSLPMDLGACHALIAQLASQNAEFSSRNAELSSRLHSQET